MELKIKLESVEIEYFKGIIKEKIDFFDNTSIYAENEGKKTTIVDAVDWCLFGKDSLGQTDFEIKTRCTTQNKANFPDSEIGDVIHNLEHTVEVSLLVNESPRKFKRLFKEKWVKKRGAVRKEFTGHEAEFFVDDVPVKKKEYEEKISELIDEDLFRMLTDVHRFNSIKWEIRRSMLEELAGETKESEIEGYSLVKDILAGKTIEEKKKIVAGKRKKINEELVKIPVQIDEAAGFIIEVEKDSKECSTQIVSCIKKKEDLENEIKAIKSDDDGQIERRQQIGKIKAEILEKTNEFNQEKSDISSGYSKQLDELSKEEDSFQQEIRVIQRHDEDLKSYISRFEQDRDRIRAEWKVIANQTDEIEKVCPTCEQDLPEWSIKETQDRLNISRSEKLEQLRKTGMDLTDEIEKSEKKFSQPERIGEVEEMLSEISKKTSGLVKKKIENDQRTIDLKELEYKKQVLEDQMSNQVAPNTSGLEDNVKNLDALIESCRKSIVDINKNQEYRDRIKSLEESEVELGKEYAKLEGDLDNIDKFIVAKVNHIEDKISGMFKISRFKMFHEQINEGIQPVCETMKDGVPYNSVNNAGRFQLGVDAIQTLQKFHGVECFIFIDNRESVTELPETDCQIISLFVSPEDKTMRIEHG